MLSVEFQVIFSYIRVLVWRLGYISKLFMLGWFAFGVNYRSTGRSIMLNRLSLARVAMRGYNNIYEFYILKVLLESMVEPPLRGHPRDKEKCPQNDCFLFESCHHLYNKI